MIPQCLEDSIRPFYIEKLVQYSKELVIGANFYYPSGHRNSKQKK
jgi:hypothetical protein